MDLSKKEIKILSNLVRETLKKWYGVIKTMQGDKNCSLQTYEDLVDRCFDLEQILKKLEKHQ